MLVGAAALGVVAIYYFATYVELTIALGNNGLQLPLKQSIEALWLTFSSHALLIALLYLLVAYRPRAVSREVIVLLGLIQLVEAVLLFAFSGKVIASLLLAIAALFVLIGALLWPRKPVESPDPGQTSASRDAVPETSGP
jgi:hypothetical protein